METLHEKCEGEGQPGHPVFTDPTTPWVPHLGPPEYDEGAEQAGPDRMPTRDEIERDHLEAEAEDFAAEPGRVGVDWEWAVRRMAPRAAAVILERAQRGDWAFALPAAVIFLAVAMETAGARVGQAWLAEAWRNV